MSIQSQRYNFQKSKLQKMLDIHFNLKQEDVHLKSKLKTLQVKNQKTILIASKEQAKLKSMKFFDSQNNDISTNFYIPHLNNTSTKQQDSLNNIFLASPINNNVSHKY